MNLSTQSKLFECSLIVQALKLHKFNHLRTALYLDMARTTLIARCHEFGINADPIEPLPRERYVLRVVRDSGELTMNTFEIDSVPPGQLLSWLRTGAVQMELRQS